MKVRLLSALLSHTVIPSRKWCVEFLKGNTGSKEGKISSGAAWNKNGWKAEFALSIDFSLRKVTYATFKCWLRKLVKYVMKLIDFITKDFETKTRIEC